MADKTLMQELGEFVGEQFGALLGGATTDYNTLGKQEAIVRELSAIVKGSEGSSDFDTLAEITAFLTVHKNDILSITDKLNKNNVVNNLTTANDVAGQGRALAAPQGKILKDTLDALTQSVLNKADKSDVPTKASLGTVSEFTMAFNQSSGA